MLCCFPGDVREMFIFKPCLSTSLHDSRMGLHGGHAVPSIGHCQYYIFEGGMVKSEAGSYPVFRNWVLKIGNYKTLGHPIF